MENRKGNSVNDDIVRGIIRVEYRLIGVIDKCIVRGERRNPIFEFVQI